MMAYEQNGSDNLISHILESVNPGVRGEVHKCLENFCSSVYSAETEALDIQKAEKWLQWSRGSKFLKAVVTPVPDDILPKHCSAELIDVKVFSKHGPDDHIYDTHKDIREKVARGQCFLRVTKGQHQGARCVLQALKKFTGGLGDDDDRDKGDETTWKKYFLKPIETTKNIISTKKANGEAAHLSCVEIDGQSTICAGSKNVHMLICNKADIAAYKGDRYRIASEICHTLMDWLEEMEADQKQRLLQFLVASRCTAVFEILSPLHQHVEDLSYLVRPVLKFITWTSTELELTPQEHLCSVAPHIGIEIARALGLDAVDYELVQPSDLMDKIAKIRQGYQVEGEVLYFLDQDNCVIGLLKKKSAWYIICRAIREKVRNSATSFLKHRSMFSCEKSVKQINERLNEIQDWLGLSDENIKKWKHIGVAFLKWCLAGLEKGNLQMLDIADKFPVIWKQHLTESNLSDHIPVEFSRDQVESSVLDLS